MVKGHLKQLTNTVHLGLIDKKKAGTVWYFIVYNHQLTKYVIKANAEAAPQVQHQGLLPLPSLCQSPPGALDWRFSKGRAALEYEVRGG